MTTPIEILVIEDEPKHIWNARSAISSKLSVKQATVSYATTYVEADALMQAKHFDGIISDLFFPYDANGKSPEAVKECYRVMTDVLAAADRNYLQRVTEDRETNLRIYTEHEKELSREEEAVKRQYGILTWLLGRDYLENIRQRKAMNLQRHTKDEQDSLRREESVKNGLANKQYLDGAKEWIEGQMMHPIGLMVAERAIREGTYFVFCSDMRRHGTHTQPAIYYESIRETRPYLLNGEFGSNRSGEKNWSQAIESMMGALEKRE